MATEAKSNDKKDLVGIDHTTVDPKNGRILLAKKFREQLENKVAITLGQKNCVNVYPMQAWDEYLALIKSFDKTNPHAQDFARLTVAYTDYADIDNGGRITINPILRKKANLVSNVTIIGNMDHLEIWAAEEFERFEQSIGDRSEAYERAHSGMVQKH